jgi:hypothetical protein
MSGLPLPWVDGTELPESFRRGLRPGEVLRDRHGRKRSLPRWYFRVDSWEQALKTQLTEHFALWELIGVDVRETPLQRSFPRYVPCALLQLATTLELLRLAAGTFVHVAANGGYRSPGHALSRHASRHCWGTAANIYRIGTDDMDSEANITKYAALAARTLPGVWVRPFGTVEGTACDHLHVDIGYTTYEPVDMEDAAGAAPA